MKRKPSERKGCDLCKVDYPTVQYDSAIGLLKLWLCERCVEVLTDWPKVKS